MNKNYQKIVVTIVIVIVIVFAILKNWEHSATPMSPADTASTSSSDPKNASYHVDGAVITLSNGVSDVEAAPGSASHIVTRYFGNEAVGDLNGDGTADTAFILTQTGGGTGTFYYAAVALKTASGYAGTNAIFLGDRIAPQATMIQNGKVIVSYAERKAGEPMTARPSIMISKTLIVQNGALIEQSN